MAERANYDATLASRGLIVPELVTREVPDESDPHGYYDQLEVSTSADPYPRFIRGTWYGRTKVVTELVWWWRDEPLHEYGHRAERPRPFLGPALRDLFARNR